VHEGEALAKKFLNGESNTGKAGFSKVRFFSSLTETEEYEKKSYLDGDRMRCEKGR